MPSPDPFELIRLGRIRRREADKVRQWMDDEAKLGNLRQNSQAPSWPDYEKAQEAWDEAVARIEPERD